MVIISTSHTLRWIYGLAAAATAVAAAAVAAGAVAAAAVAAGH